MSKIGKTMKGALVGVIRTASVVAAGAVQAGTPVFEPPTFSDDDNDWSGVYCDENGSGQGLDVDVRFDGPDGKCLNLPLDTFRYKEDNYNDKEGEWFFSQQASAYYDRTSNCSANYGDIGHINSSTDWNLMKFEIKWTDEARGPGKPSHKFYNDSNTIEIKLKRLGEVAECEN